MIAETDNLSSSSQPDAKDSPQKEESEQNDRQNTPKRARKTKIIKDDVLNIARLVATRGLLQKEACLLLGINHRAFENWKSRHKHLEKFDELLAHEKAIKIKGCFDSMEMKGFKDWRMDDKMLERIAPERFAQQQNQGESKVAVIMGDDALKAILDKVYGAKAVVDVEPLKQIEQGK